MKLKFTKNNKEKGFTILFAVVVSSLVLAIGLSIAHITLKQVILSSTGRESQIAFYAADSGAECALYHDSVASVDLGFDIFPSGDFAGNNFEASNINCGGELAVDKGSTADENSAISIFEVRFGDNPEYCATVSVEKEDNDFDTIADSTTIISRGYNSCDPTNSRRLERALKIEY